MTPLRDFLSSFFLCGCQTRCSAAARTGWRNVQLRGRLPRAFVRWCMCEPAPPLHIAALVCLSPHPDIKTVARKTVVASVGAGSERMSADKVGQESTTRMLCSWASGASVFVCARMSDWFRISLGLRCFSSASNIRT